METIETRSVTSNPTKSREHGHGGQNQVMFFTFGMFIIDEIEFSNPARPKKHNLPGGAGLYALLGARLLSPPPTSHHLSWILDAGSDFPPNITTQLQSWATCLRIRHDLTRLTTRAWNGYGVTASGSSKSPNADEHRAFKYLTPKRRLDVEDLTDHEVEGKGWHLVCSPTRCMDVTGKLERRRRTEIGCHETGATGVVWEPIPDLCTPVELENLRRAARGVDVVSPNAEELCAFFGEEEEYEEEGPRRQDELVKKFMGWDGRDRKGSTACVVREGKNGSTIYMLDEEDEEEDEDMDDECMDRKVWRLHLPAYHDWTMSDQVIDPTGGGNTYLGALALVLAYVYPSASRSTGDDTSPPSPPSSLLSPSRLTPAIPNPIVVIQNKIQPVRSRLSARQMSLLTAGIGACVVAGFAIEQNGVPELKPSSAGQGEELWGGSRVHERIEMYLEREWEGIKKQVEIDRKTRGS